MVQVPCTLHFFNKGGKLMIDEKTDRKGPAGDPQYDRQIPQAKEIIDAIKEIWKRGNASRLDIEKGGKTLLSVSLAVGTIGLVLAPVAALIGIGAALITDYVITITLDNGTVINVNDFAVKRGSTTEPRDAGEDAPDTP